MKTYISLMLVLTSMVTQALSPEKSMPLKAHMLEVNAQWQHYDADPIDMLFENDRQRIQKHLFLVHEALSVREDLSLTPEAKLNRQRLLDTLYTYAAQGAYPINTGHLERTPYFIDDFGTACAVGYLIIASGHEQMAMDIHEKFNYNYLAEMPQKEIEEWAMVHGFSFQELEWIQPAYPYYPTLRFVGVHAGFQSTVYKTEYLPNEDVLCFAGNSDMMLGKCFTCIQNDAPAFSGYASTLVGEGRDFCEKGQGMFMLAGTFQDGAEGRGLVELSSSGDSLIDLGFSYTSSVVLRSDSSTIFDAYNGSTSVVLEIVDGQSAVIELAWLDGIVNALEFYQDDLLIGGEFDLTMTASDSLHQSNFVRLSGQQLVSMQDPFSVEVKVISVIDDEIYIAGSCDSSQASTSCIQRWDGTHWNTVLSEPTLKRLSDLNANALWFSDVMIYNDTLLVAGQFNYSDMGSFNYTGAQNLMQISIDGDAISYAWFNGITHSLTVDQGGQLIVAGAFTTHTYHHENAIHMMQFSTFSVPYAARAEHDLVGLNEVSASGELLTFPNPSSATVTIQTDRSISSWRLMDQLGSVVKAGATLGVEQLEMNVSDLPQGVYWVELTDGDDQRQRCEIVVAR